MESKEIHILKVKKIQKVINHRKRKKTNISDASIQALTLKWRWDGHISCYTDNRWTIQTTIWKGPVGKRYVGRPIGRWASGNKKLLHKIGCLWGKTVVERKRKEAYTQENGIHITKTKSSNNVKN